MNSKKSYKSKIKEAIIDCLKEQENKTLTVKEVLDYLHEVNSSANLSTIYRNLETLSAEGRIQKYYSIKDDSAVYQYAKEGGHCEQHLHIQCIKCGSLSHLDCDYEYRFREHIKEHHQFVLLPSGSLLYGICQDCQDIS